MAQPDQSMPAADTASHDSHAMAPKADGDVAARIAKLEAQVAQLERMNGSAGGATMASAAPRATTARPTATAGAHAAPAAAHTEASAGAHAAPAKAEMKMPAGGGRFGAHLGSYRTTDEAKNGWATLAKANPETLGPLSYQTTEFDPGDGRGVFVRLLAGPFDDRSKAQNLCRDLQPKRVFCRVLSLGPA